MSQLSTFFELPWTQWVLEGETSCTFRARAIEIAVGMLMLTQSVLPTVIYNAIRHS